MIPAIFSIGEKYNLSIGNFRMSKIIPTLIPTIFYISMSTQEDFSKITNYLGKSQLAEAIEVLIESGMSSEGISLKGRLAALEQDKIDGTLTHEQEQIERNKIQKAILTASQSLQSSELASTTHISGNRILTGAGIGIAFLFVVWGIGKFALPSSTSSCNFEQDLPEMKNFLIMIPSHQESLIGETRSVLDEYIELDTIPFDLAVDDQSFSKQNRLNRQSAIQKGSACNADLISWLSPKPISQTVSMHYAWLDTSTNIKWIEKIGATNIEMGSRLFDGELAGSIKSISEYFMGMGHFSMGNYEKALMNFQQVNPDTTIGQKFILYYLGSCQRKLGEKSRTKGQSKRSVEYFQQARQSYLQALAIDSLFAEAQHDLALIFYYEDSSDLARKRFEKVLTFTDKQDLREKAYLNLANLAVLEQRLDEASDLLGNITSNNQQLFNFKLLQSSILIGQKRYDEALALIESMQPTSAQDTLKWWNQKGIALESLNRDKEALVIYDRIIARFPKYVNAYQNRGNLHYHNQDFGLATKDFQQVIEMDPDRSSIYFLLGRIKERTNDITQAKAYYRRTLVQKENHLPANIRIARIYETEKSRDSMAYFYEQAFSYMPDDFSYENESKAIMMNNAAYTLGVVMDTFDIAERFLKQAVQIDEHYAGAYGSLAEVYGKHEKEDLFFSTLDQAINKGYDFPMMEDLEAEPYRSFWGDPRLTSLIEKYPGMFPKDIPPELFQTTVIN